MSDHYPGQHLIIYAACALVFLCSCIGYAGAQNESPSVVINVKALRQDSSPVRILGIRVPAGSTHNPLVHLRNFSSVKTSRLWIEVTVRGPQTRAIRMDLNTANDLWPGEHEIAPGAEVWSKEPVLASRELLDAAAHLQTSCMMADVRVTRVEFVDGTQWMANGEPNAPPANEDWANICKNATASQSEIGHLRSTRAFFLPEQELKYSREVQSFSFMCSLQSDGSGFFGSCPY